MHKICLLIVIFVSLSSSLFAQEVVVDTIPNSKKIIVKDDSSFTKKNSLDPLSPSKATFYSAILPGLGQIYNKKYWKVPLVYGLLAGGIYLYQRNNNLYHRYRDAFKSRRIGLRNDEFWGVDAEGNPLAMPILRTNSLEDAQTLFQRNRDLSLLVTIGLYVLNIIDANIDAHLKQFNVNENLSLEMEPYIQEHNYYVTSNYFGLQITLNFKK